MLTVHIKHSVFVYYFFHQ